MNSVAVLERLVESFAELGHPASLERFTLRNGRAYERGPTLGARTDQGQCFRNATLYALEHSQARYVEGFAWTEELIFPIHHAWVEIDGKAMDATWDETETVYVGVAFDTDAVSKRIQRTGYYGLFVPGDFIDIDFLCEIDPGLRDIIEDFKKSSPHGGYRRSAQFFTD